MRSFKILVVGLVVGLSPLACSTSSSKGINYRDSVITPTLEVPPDLVSRLSDKNLTLPGTRVGTAENTGRFVESGNLNIEVKTLPVLDDIRLEGQGDMHWLVVDRPAEKIYPLVKQFWLEQGFKLVKDEPIAGIMETQWLGLKSGNDSFLASFLASMRAAESRDQYQTRIERSAGNSNIYLVHRAQEQVIDENSEALAGAKLKQGWQFVPSDPAKEVDMLSRLMMYLGLQDDQVKQQLEKIGQFSARADIKFEEEKKPFLIVKYGYDQSWNRVMYQMDRLAVPVTDQHKGENKGTMALDIMALSSRGLKRAEANAAGRMTIQLEGSVNSNVTRLDVLNEEGNVEYSDDARQLLDFLLEQLR